MSEFFARKAKTYFKHIDVNNDGYISLNDFLEIGERNCEAEKVDADERDTTRASLTAIWRKWMKSAGSDDSGLLTPYIFAESVFQQRNDPDFKEAYLSMLHHYFHILDTNCDGFLQEDEYARSLANGDIQDHAGIARRAFELIDINKDGKLSVDEFCSALFEYLTSDDENNRLAGLGGPLVD